MSIARVDEKGGHVSLGMILRTSVQNSAASHITTYRDADATHDTDVSDLLFG